MRVITASRSGRFAPAKNFVGVHDLKAKCFFSLVFESKIVKRIGEPTFILFGWSSCGDV